MPPDLGQDVVSVEVSAPLHYPPGLVYCSRGPLPDLLQHSDVAQVNLPLIAQTRGTQVQVGGKGGLAQLNQLAVAAHLWWGSKR